ncbi:MAG TPA: tail fiber domain-containing protein, partial [Salinivirgaceae bacterium]|nr:tail fiber domain-containing protein [Salinivirgaceae bacterium]
SIKVNGEKSFGIGLNDINDSITANNTMAIMGGNVGIGTVSPSALLQVNGAALASAWNINSDKRLKTNIKPLEGALQSVLKLQGVSFNWKDETNHRQGRNVGFIAQEVKEILPEIVSGGGKDEQGNEIYYSIEYATLTPVLVEAIKELNVENKSLNDTNKEQNKTIEELKGAIKEQKEQIDKLIEELKSVKEQLNNK